MTEIQQVLIQSAESITATLGPRLGLLLVIFILLVGRGLGLGFGLAKIAFAGSIWNVFRRRIPDLTQDDLLLHNDPVVHHHADDDLRVVRKLTEGDKLGLKAAFCTSPHFIWLLKGDDKLKGEEDFRKMASVTSYLMDFIIYLAENYGHIIKSVDEDGNYQGSIVLIPPVTPLLYKAYAFQAMMRIGKPPSCLWDDAGRRARFSAFSDIDRYHHDVMQDCIDDHWYVLNLGVAPSAQGKRVGTRLLQQAIHLAGDKPLFLNCHNGNVAYYEKYGFECSKNYAFETPKGTSNATFYYNAMRRDPQ